MEASPTLPATQQPVRKLTFPDILEARSRLRRWLPSTPFFSSPTLRQLLGTEVRIKCEHQTLIGSFKWRGALTCLEQIDADRRRAGVVTASTGNHGLGVALAGHFLKTPVFIHLPENANRGKRTMISALGATVVSAGYDFDDCKRMAREEARRRGRLFIEDGNELSISTGTATIGLEMLEQQPDIDVVFVPVGNGSLISGIAFVLKTIRPQIRVIGVQSEGAPCMYLSWKRRRRVETPSADTFADGIAVRVPTRLSLRLMRKTVDRMLLVSEEEIQQAVYLLLRRTHNVIEGAGAASLAAALKMKAQLKGKRVALVLSGGNLEPDRLLQILRRHSNSQE